MSNRTLVELNHDYCPHTDAALKKWAEAMMNYMCSGDKSFLPEGVTFKHMRHHSEPEPMRLPSCAKCKRECEHEAEIYSPCPTCGNRTWNFYGYATTAPITIQAPIRGKP